MAKKVKKLKAVIVKCGSCGDHNHVFEDAVQEDGTILGTVYHEGKPDESIEGQDGQNRENAGSGEEKTGAGNGEEKGLFEELFGED